MKPLLVTLSLTLILATTVPPEAVGQEQLRSWTSRDKSQTIEATFKSYDPRTKQLILKLLNGEELQVKLKQLSRTDQRYVTNASKRNTKELLSPDTTEFVGTPKKKRKRMNRDRSLKTTKAFGIEWNPGMESALTKAQGGESASDDRPVMWLRVLGDLDGFM